MNKNDIRAIAATIRTLTIDAVQKAKSGHPGLPMGCAELGSLLFGEIMNIQPRDPQWKNRDRFILSAGHGSMFLYSLLYLAGFGLTRDDIMNFRQLNSKTPGHPEYGVTPGVETTTGPLGAGFGNAVGIAIAETYMAARFNTKRRIVDHYTYVLSGDGCMMEGVTSEAASLAGHLGLGKLIVFYDSNGITIEGSTDLAFTENVAARFEAYNWQVLKGDAYDIDAVRTLVAEAKSRTDKPSIIILMSVIGKGSPNMAGSHEVHGAPLGTDEVKATKRNLGIGENEMFYTDPAALAFFTERRREWDKTYAEWQETYKLWGEENPELKKEFESYFTDRKLNLDDLPSFKTGESVATRSAGGKCLNAAAKVVPNLLGGSADLAPSNKTDMPGLGNYSRRDRKGRNFHFGVREHAMGAITNGLALYGGLRPFCATFFVFSDYMRPAIRLASIMKLPVIYIFTHDSIYVGEDGPTHQPVEHMAALRLIPGLTVLRPADAEETAVAWKIAIDNKKGPTVLALTRQNLPVLQKDDPSWKENIFKGAYTVREARDTPEVVLLATGSEVELAVRAAEASPKRIRVVSMLSRELFNRQSAGYRERVLPKECRTIVVEAGVSFGWEGFTENPADIVAVDRFGECGPYEKLMDHFGFSVENLLKVIG